MEALSTAVVLGSFAHRSLRPLDDPDLGWHLAAGERVLAGLGVPWVDGFSQVAEGRTWIAYSWLPETLFAACRRAAGDLGLVVLGTVLVCATVAVLLRTCRATGARAPAALAVTVAAALVTSFGWSVRPHLASFLCMAITSHLLVLDRRRGVDRLWWLVPTMVLWANCHILFPFGLVLLGVHALTAGRAWWARPGRRVALLAAVAVAPLATPYGWHLLPHVAVMMHQPVAFGMVAEFATPSLHELAGLLLTAFFFAAALVLVRSPLRADAAELASVFGFGFLAYAMGRNMPFFAIAAAPALARHVEALLPRRARVAPRLGAGHMVLHAAILATGAAMLALRLGALAGPGAAVSAKDVPVGAVHFLCTRPPLGRLFNHFNWGGYLIGTLYPRYRVSMDGRTQVYGEETLAAYVATATLAPGWRGFFDRVDPDVVLWPRHGALARVLELLPEWEQAYADDTAVVFVRSRVATARPGVQSPE
jgi:hypothetical protein